jgi:hypothetical protein
MITAIQLRAGQQCAIIKQNGNRGGRLFDSLHLDGFCLTWVVVGPGRMFFHNSIVNARARLRTNIIINSGPVLKMVVLGRIMFMWALAPV